ncbi:MAG TPA: hypothetical protein VF395_16745 [Polyangiaceae bacterium]
MSVEDQITKLESLLDRIKRRAAEPRPAAAALTVASHAPMAAPAAVPMAERAPMSAAPVTAQAEPRAAHVAPPPPPVLAPVARATPPAGTPSVRVQEAAPAELEELDMMDAEIVEIEAVAPRGQATAIDLDGMEDEPVPESAPRAAQALADEADLEPPVKTPPPESGRQVMGPAGAAPSVTYQEEPEEVDLSGGGDIAALLEADHSGGPISRAPPGRPTMEQLGDTVELEGADAPAAELELLMPTPEHEAVPDELEQSLPRQEFAGGYDSSLPPPSRTAADLERHGDPARDIGATAGPQSLAEPSSMAMSAMPPTELAPVQPPPAPAVAAPLVVERPPVSALHAAEVIVAEPAKLPETFLDLLDGSLRL